MVKIIISCSSKVFFSKDFRGFRYRNIQPLVLSFSNSRALDTQKHDWKMICNINEKRNKTKQKSWARWISQKKTTRRGLKTLQSREVSYNFSQELIRLFKIHYVVGLCITISFVSCQLPFECCWSNDQELKKIGNWMNWKCQIKGFVLSNGSKYGIKLLYDDLPSV